MTFESLKGKINVLEIVRQRIYYILVSKIFLLQSENCKTCLSKIVAIQCYAALP